uniref:Uncharacterized protein n=1 Tax=Avena sativa TaxID=4498 RepID=A0ACD5V9Y3_AVESA
MSLQAVAWGISVAGWILSPIISKLLDKALSYCKDDKKNTLSNLLANVLPRLALALEAVEAVGKRDIFEKMVRGLKSAFYDIEDILDELDYIRHQRQLDAQAKSDKKKKGKINVDAEAGPSKQDISIEAIMTLPGALNCRLKDNMRKIKVLLDEAQSIIPLAELVDKSKKTKRSGKNVSAKDNNSSTPKVKVTGRDEDRSRIAEMLRDTKDDVDPSSSDSKCFSVIGIYGISGSGKTTLAQHVCKYEENENYFDLVIWIHVSQNYSACDILKEMFEAASTDKEACPDYISLDVLEKELQKKLVGKRFLLVLDDIWCDQDDNEQKLENLLSPLNLGKRGSKILATSRNKDAFSDLGPGVAPNVFPICDLDDDVFLELFMYYALDSTNSDDSDQMELRSYCAKIAQKLKGSPLAARMVGGQLRKKQKDVNFWRMTLDRDLLNETTGAVWWSYQQLDEQVKRCFSYCGIFPRRHSLDRDDLVKLWVAEGFIQTANPEEDLEVVGQCYFDELLATSFMQPGELEYNRGKSCYVVHDLMYDLAEKVAGDDCFRIENGLRRQVPRDVRHLFVANGEMLPKEIFKLKNLRTLIIHVMEWSESTSEIFLQKVFKKLRKLRVLTVKYTCEKIRGRIVFVIPRTIDHLKHLRHLALMLPVNSKLNLPGTLTKLYHLRVLNFRGCSELVFPHDIDVGKLSNLRHLSLCFPKMTFPNIARLTSLQTLELFKVRIELGYEIKQLRNLNKLQGHLTIADVGNVKSKNEAHEANLAAKTRLTELKLVWEHGTASPEVEAEVLEGLCPPMGLKNLEIMGYQGLEYPSWMVGVQNGAPEYLNTLLLCKCYQLGPAPELFKCFIHLRELVIWRSCWEYFPDNVKDLKWLKILTIEICLNLKSLPELPRSLENFTMVDCERGFTKSCNQVNHPNWQKLQHVKNHIAYHSDDS